ncbi:4-hydroxyproline epimerase [Candidatus Spongiihabitans sp.]|uniref:4-hydroxyproline epimerase n=1 Tax=Candidatus Spongiihabitans sp. TaxID=3101308 RepID=UPI003C7B6FF2
MTRTVFKCVDAHTCGNPVRVVTANGPDLTGQSMSEKRQHFIREYDWIRTSLMFEPRGHDAMSGSILYPPIAPDSDLGVLFIEVSGCLPMCGHGAIGTATIALEQNLVTPNTPGLLKMDTPAGLIEARYEITDGYVDSVTLTNVPSFLHSTEVTVTVPEIGELIIDISYGGNFYAIIEPQKNYQGLEHISVDQIRAVSSVVRNEINKIITVVHPENETIKNVSHIMWTDKARDENAKDENMRARNAVFYGERGIDRSPCGTGTSARIAQLVSRGDLDIGQKFVHESIIGSLFTGCAIKQTQVGDYPAIIPTITGWAQVTGHNNIIVDTRDPYAHGFLLGGQ